MSQKLLRRACLLGLLLVMASTSAVLAAPSQQTEEPTPGATLSSTPSATLTPPRGPLPTPTTRATLEVGGTSIPFVPGATPSPTITLLPPPIGGGRVVAEVLYVREGPSFGTAILGSLFYNDIVLPLGRNAEGDWLAVGWKDQIGWVWASLVIWDPALRIEALPVASAGGTLSPGAPTVTASTPSPTLARTPTPRPSPTGTSLPTATATPQPPAVPSPLPAATLSPSPSNPLGDIQDPLKSGLLIGGGVVALGLAGYVWRRFAGLREMQRYARGFLFDICPACHEGRLHLDQIVLRSIGIPVVRRSVRCDTCRSMLREVRPGRWRYTIDPFVNPEMASKYNTRWLSRVDLETLARSANVEKSARRSETEISAIEQISLPDVDEDLFDENSFAEDEGEI